MKSIAILGAFSFLSFASSSSSLSFNLRRHHFVVIFCVISNVGAIEGIIVVIFSSSAPSSSLLYSCNCIIVIALLMLVIMRSSLLSFYYSISSFFISVILSISLVSSYLHCSCQLPRHHFCHSSACWLVPVNIFVIISVIFLHAGCHNNFYRQSRRHFCCHHHFAIAVIILPIIIIALSRSPSSWRSSCHFLDITCLMLSSSFLSQSSL